MNEYASKSLADVHPIVEKRFKKIASKIDELADKNRKLAFKIQDEKRAREDLERQEVHLGNMPGKMLPFRHQINIPLPGGTDTLVTGEVNISRDGPFVCKRIYASLLITDAPILELPPGPYDYSHYIGRYAPVTSVDSYVLWAVSLSAGGSLTFTPPPLDFDWKYRSSGTGRNRENKPISGDVLYRRDDDGFLMNNEFFAAGSTIYFTVIPTRQVGDFTLIWLGEEYSGFIDVELKITFDGFKILQPLEM